MSDADQTIISSRDNTGGAPPAPQKSGRNPLILIGGIGCALLLCALLFIGGGIYLASDQLEQLSANLLGGVGPTPTETATIEPTATETLIPEPTATETPTAEMEADSTTTAAGGTETSLDASPTAMLEPEMGAITFALAATKDYEPVNPGIAFTGEITEVHAIFEYSGFSPDDVWQRVWYRDGEEVLRSAEPWSGAEAGIFDYFINAGGDPLSVGEWVLELYVGDELLATGMFTISAEASASTVTETPTPVLVSAVDTASEHSEDVAVTSSAGPSPTTPSVTASTATPTPTPTAVAKTYKLAYTKWDGGAHNLYIGDTDGSSEQYIIDRAAGPSWSPDGQYIYFYGEEGIDWHEVNGVRHTFSGVTNGIVRINMSPVPANIGQVAMYQGPGWNDGTARWANVSPNGQMVAFDGKPSGNYRIYFLGTDENQQFRYELIGEQADWSPDSQQVVYRSGRDGRTGIWISNRDDSGHIQISGEGSDSFPAWSPDGNTIVFSRDQEGNVDLYAMNPDGTDVRRLTTAPGPDTLPEFTLDGQIVFRSARSGRWAIWKMQGDGSAQQEIVADANVGPDWSQSRMSVLP